MPKTLYLIDGHAQIFRAYHAIRNGMNSPVTGEPTHAVFGVCGMLIKLLSQYEPDYVAVALDSPGKVFRNDLYPEYKAHRDPPPEDLIAQIPRVIQLFEAFGLPIIAQEGIEADDILATITDRLSHDPALVDLHVKLVAKDKDLEQLLTERVSMVDIQNDTENDIAKLLDEKGIRPDQVIDVQALCGDTVDNLPGVPGIGLKTAAQLIAKYGTLEELLDHTDELTPAKKKNIEETRDKLPLYRQLVTLKRDADVPFELAEAKVDGVDVNRLMTLFEELGFNRYRDEVAKLAERLGKSSHADAEPLTLPFDEPDAAPLTTAEDAEYRAILTADELAELVETLRGQPMVSIDTETTGLSHDAAICGICLAWETGRGVYIPTRSPEPERHLDTATVLDALRPILSDPGIPKCGHNLKFDVRVLLHHGIHLRGVAFDSLLAGQLLPRQGGQKLDQLAESLLGHRMIPLSSLLGEGYEDRTIDQAPLEEVVAYGAEDADIALRLYEVVAPQLDEVGMAELMRDVEAPLTAVLAVMEHNGIVCDPAILKEQGEVLQARVDELVEEIQRVAKVHFDLNSTKQVAEVLYNQLGLPTGRKTKTGYSTNIEELERLAALEDRDEPKTSVPRLMIEYRMLTKLISTYLGSLQECIRRETGRIHTTFHQLYTATGRLVSHGPNLQNIPVRTEIGRQIRKAFVAPEGMQLICADYSQIELRLLAHLSGDPGLVEAFRNDLDIHSIVAAQVFGVDDLADVTREQRDQAKVINFGIIYGITAFGLARRIEGMDVGSAGRLIDDYKARFPGIDQFLAECVQQATDQGYVTTILGRRRQIDEIRSSNRGQRQLGERLAINSVVQGSAADLIKVAMVKLQDRIDAEGLPSRMLLQIHDELVLETPAEIAEEQSAVVVDVMEHALELDVPLRCSAGVGPDWLSAK